MSIEINSTNIKVGNIDNFIDLSNFLYNRHTHDKTMFVEVSEIDFVVNVESIIDSSNVKDKFFELVKLNYSSLFGTSVSEDIKFLTKGDLIEICDYNYTSDSFNGLEYYILRHLKDSHINKCIEDLRAKRLDKLIRVCVSKGNLIVKVFPSKVLGTENQVSYCVSLLYLVLMHIHKHLHKECGICEIIKALFIRVNPIVTKVAYTVLVNCNDSYSWLKQLQQLSSMYKFFNISSSKDQVKFLFRPKRHYLTTTVNVPVINEIPSDTNNEKRFISCTYKLRKQDVLECKTTIISKDMVDCVFATQIDDNVGSMYSALSDSEHIYLSNYDILDTLLSFTKQHEELRNRLRLNGGMEFANTNNSMPVSFRQNAIVSYIRRNLYQQAFRDIKATNDEELLALVINKLKKVGQKNSLVDYSIVIMELLYKEKEFVEEILANLDERTSNKIRKVLNNLKKCKRIENLFSLNEFCGGC